MEIRKIKEVKINAEDDMDTNDSNNKVEVICPRYYISLKSICFNTKLFNFFFGMMD